MSLRSALERRESRGAHQRSDFPELKSSCEFNLVINLDNTNCNLEINKIPLKKLNQKLKKIVSFSSREEDIRNKLLE